MLDSIEFCNGCHDFLQPMACYLGISGEHQRSCAVILDQDDSSMPVAVSHGGTMNLHASDLDRVGLTLSNLLTDLARAKGHGSLDELASRVDAAVLSLPGAATEDDQRQALRCLERSGWPLPHNVRIVDDTWAALVGGALTTEGVCAVSGTGCSVFVGVGGFETSRERKIDDWGPLLGDRGSGFELATKLLRLVLLSYDQGRPLRAFERLRRCPEFEGALDSVQDVPMWIDRLFIDFADDWRSVIGRIATAATELAEEDQDSEVAELVREAACAIADSVIIAAKRFVLPEHNVPVVFSGGMFEHSNLYRQTAASRIREHIPLSVMMARYRPPAGALIMASANDAYELDPLTVEQIVAAFDACPSPWKDALAYPDGLDLSTT